VSAYLQIQQNAKLRLPLAYLHPLNHSKDTDATVLSTQCFKGIWVSQELCPKLCLSQFFCFFSPWHVNSCKCCQLSSTAARQSHWVTTFVWNTLAVTESVK